MARTPEQEIQDLLKERVEKGTSFKKLSQQAGVSVSTVIQWAQKEKVKGTELGRMLCHTDSRVGRRTKEEFAETVKVAENRLTGWVPNEAWVEPTNEGPVILSPVLPVTPVNGNGHSNGVVVDKDKADKLIEQFRDMHAQEDMQLIKDIIFDLTLENYQLRRGK